MTVKAENMILDLLVQTNPKGIVELESTAGIVRMIPFGGTVSGPLFQGIIEPCGVDTQIINTVGVRHMSARYMLTGTDHTGLRSLFHLTFADAFSQTLGFLRLFISETGAAAKLSF